MLLYILLILCLFVVHNAEIEQGSINTFTMKDFNEMMDKKDIILVFAKNVNCRACEEDRWWTAKVPYNFLLTPNFYVLETQYGDLPEFDREFHVKEDYENPQYFLFRDGNRKPLKHENSRDLADWVTKVTLEEHLPDYVVSLDKDSFATYRRKNPKKDLFVMFYDPSYSQTHFVVSNFFRNAFAFHMEYHITFVLMNCRDNIHFCEDAGIKAVLGFRYIARGAKSFDGEELRTVKGDGITSFVNRHLGTQISGMGGFNEQFGRVDVLDALARRFIATEDVAERKEIMKETARLRKRYKSCAKYYKVMKKVVQEGEAVLAAEKEAVGAELKEVKEYNPHYESLRTYENVLHVFEKLDFDHKVVHLTPWTWSAVVDGQHNVMVLLKTSTCHICRFLGLIYENAAREGVPGVVFADINGDEYIDFVADINTDPDVPAFWFQKGVSPSAGIPAKIETNVDSIFKFAREHMTPVDDSNDVSDASNEKGGASNEVSGASNEKGGASNEEGGASDDVSDAPNDVSDAPNEEGGASNDVSGASNDLSDASNSEGDATNAESTTPNELEKEKEQSTNPKQNEDDETTVDNAEL
ncbi:hypothetical protein WA556_004201 [Blastocystis sp. ATCC 50177/Nand II]